MFSPRSGKASRPNLPLGASASWRTAGVVFDGVLQGLVGAGFGLEALCAYLVLAREALFEHVVRLGLPTPPDTAQRKPTAKSWTVEDIRLLIAWRTSAVHPEVIGQNLARTRSANAVRAKARRLGLPVPPRKSLFRPTAEQLGLPLAPTPVALGPPLRPIARSAPPAPLVGGQRLLPLAPRFIPTRIEELDLDDLTWIGSLSGRRGRPGAALAGISTNRAAVYAVGLVTCAGVDREVAAALLGLTVGSYRTLRTRLGVPPVSNKDAFTQAFDREVGEETIERAGLEIVASVRRQDDRPPVYFWRFQNERHVRLAPGERAQRARGETVLASRSMNLVTRAVLDAEIRYCGRKPAAGPTMIYPKPGVSTRPILPIIPPRPAPGLPFVPPGAMSRAAFATARASLGA